MKRLGLLGEAEPQQRVERERRVADPGVAVVPVAHAADAPPGRLVVAAATMAPGRAVGQQLQRQRRAAHHLAPAAAVGAAGDPAPPVVGRLVEELAARTRGATGRECWPSSGMRSSTKVRPSPAVDRELRPHVAAGALERHRRVERQRQVGRRRRPRRARPASAGGARGRSRSAARGRAAGASRPRTPCTWRTIQCRSTSTLDTGMKSTSSQTPFGDRKRVMRTLVSGRYSCLQVASGSFGPMRKRPPRRSSRMRRRRSGESKRGQQYQSIVPSVATRATVCRSPMTPCSSIGA